MPSANYVPLVCEQPTTATMDASSPHPTEKATHCHHQNLQSCGDDHRKCHSSRLRRFTFPIAFALLGLIVLLLALTCLYDGHFSGWGLDELLARDTSSTGTSGSFVKNKLYLIVLFVGLVIVIFLAIALSFWCCRGAFKNPLCCPCYLCACCGGLVCLECIGCGLCAEAIEQA